MNKDTNSTESQLQRNLTTFYKHSRIIIRHLFTTIQGEHKNRLARYITKAFAADCCVVFGVDPSTAGDLHLIASDSTCEEIVAARPMMKRQIIESAQQEYRISQGSTTSGNPAFAFSLDSGPQALLDHNLFNTKPNLHVLHLPLIDRKSEQIGIVQIARRQIFTEVDLILGQLLASQLVISFKTIEATKEIIALPVDISNDSILDQLCSHCRAVLRCKDVWVFEKAGKTTTILATSSGGREQCCDEVLNLADRVFASGFSSEVTGIQHNSIAQLVVSDEGLASVIVAEPMTKSNAGNGENYGFDAFDLELLSVVSKQFLETQRSLRYRKEMDEIFHQLLESPKNSTLYSFLSKVVRLYFDDKAKCILYWADHHKKRLVARQYYHGDDLDTDLYKGFTFSFSESAFATHVFDRHKCPDGIQSCGNAVDAPCISQKGREHFRIGDNVRIIGIRLEFANRPVGVLVAWGDGVPENAANQALKQLSIVAGASIAFYAREGSRTAVLEECSRLLNSLQSGVGNKLIHQHIVEAAVKAGFDRARLFTLAKDGNAFELVASKPELEQSVLIRFEDNRYAYETYYEAKKNPHPIVYSPDDLGPDPHANALDKDVDLQWAVAPLIKAGRVVGQLVVDNALTKQPIDSELDLKALGLLATMGAVAIEDGDRKGELGDFETEEQQVGFWIIRSLFLSDLMPDVVLYYRFDADRGDARLYGSLVASTTHNSSTGQNSEDISESRNTTTRSGSQRMEIVDRLESTDPASATALREILDKYSLQRWLQRNGGRNLAVGLTGDLSLALECGEAGESRIHTKNDLSFFGKLANDIGMAAVVAVEVAGRNPDAGGILVIGRIDDRASDDPVIADTIFTRNHQLHLSTFADRAARFLSELGLSRLPVSDRAERVQQEFRLTPFEFLHQHVSRTAYAKISEPGSTLRRKFDGALQNKRNKAFVLSVDIRRSTDLMLQSITPTAFAEFITGLVDDIRSAIFEFHGVYDKFTGDGVLAFFPEFFSEKDSGLRALMTAEKCHRIFKKRHDESLQSFHNPQWNAGLGIGISYGDVELVQEWERLTVVGRPVVYACRYGSCPADKTYLSQQAYSQVSTKYGAHIVVESVPLEIKNANPARAYDIRLRDGLRRPLHEPSWLRG